MRPRRGLVPGPKGTGHHLSGSPEVPTHSMTHSLFLGWVAGGRCHSAVALCSITETQQTSTPISPVPQISSASPLELMVF